MLAAGPLFTLTHVTLVSGVYLCSMETRAQAKQQELEGQVSQLLAMMDTQTQRQEQLAAESQHHLTQLFSAQQKMQVDLTQQYQQFADEHRKQLNKFIEVQENRCRAMEEKQLGTEELVKSVESDMASLKSLLQSHLRKVEDEVDTLRDAQEQMAKDLLTTKSSCKEELLSEMHTKQAPAPLHAATPALTPGPSISDTGILGIPSSRTPSLPQMTKPLPYDGQSSWEAYKLQFEMLAQLNGWNEAQKATYLAVSLRGTALTILTNLPPGQRSEYRSLLSALDNRFGTAHQTELNRVKLRNRTRRREESLPELAEDIECLSRLAYPDAAPGMLDVLAKDQFIDAMTDEDMRLRIRQNKPMNLREALEYALELESYYLANKQRIRVARETQLEQDRAPSVNKADLDQSSDVLEKLQKCVVDAVQQCTNYGRNARSNSAGRGRGRGRGLVCWNCGERGHPERLCTKERRRGGVGGHSQSGNDQ